MLSNARHQAAAGRFAMPDFSRLVCRDESLLGPAFHAEIVGYLFANFWPVAIMGLGYVALSLIAYRESHDLFFALLGLIGGAVALAHVSLLLLYRRLPSAARQGDVAGLWERRYAIVGYLFSLCLGLMEAKLFLGPYHGATLLGVALLYGYGSGIVARTCMRPRVAAGSLVLATLPALGGMVAHGNFGCFSLAAFTFVFLLAGFETVCHIYQAIVSSMDMRHELAALARRDELTGLPNRLQMRERLNHEMARVMRTGGLVAVHYLDLDRFKTANDKFGHPTGDALLKQVAERLRHLVRSGDVVGRLGGDEFLIVQTGLAHASEAEVLAMRILRAIASPFEIQGREITIGTSIGIAFAPADTSDMATLIDYADMALYRAKARARSCYVFHKDEAEGEGGGSKDETAAIAQNSGSV